VSGFDAYRIFENNGKVESRVVKATLDELSAGEVVIRTAFSSVNYKDALAATGAGRIVRNFPLIGGIDVAGSVVSSTDPGFSEGDEVLVHGYGLGVTHDGGYAEYVRVPAEWVVPRPEGLSAFAAMAIGTAGFTAAQSIVRLEQNGLSPHDGPVLVTGATGGVGSVAVELLAGLGYSVTALTGKDDGHDHLRSLGATEVLSRHELEMGTRPLEKSTWAGAVDAVGGDILAWLTRTTKYGGSIACSGLTAGINLKTTVMPFILRGVSLLGIDSAVCPMERRREVWRRLATDMKPTRLPAVANEITLDGLPDAFSTLLAGEARGRIVVGLAQASGPRGR
jgi:NADPH2:quinone reductase